MHSPLHRSQFGIPLAITACALGCATAWADTGDTGSPSGAVLRVAQPVADEYIVIVDAQATIDAGSVGVLSADLASVYGGVVGHVYSTALEGFSVTMADSDAQALSTDPRVRMVEEVALIETAAEWGLDRIDQRTLPLDGQYNTGLTGAPVRAYVIDQGIRASHQEFGGRVVPGFSAFSDGTNDCGGHGTHVAGILGGATYGVAKGVTLVPVKVFPTSGAGCGSGTTASFIAGVDWAASDYDDYASSPPYAPGVANMSLGVTGGSEAVDWAVNGAINAGLHVVAAAMNSNADACGFSPARVPRVNTVGGTNSADQRHITSSTLGSNWGSCVDLFAPGKDVRSSSFASDTATATMTGTSQASPHVAGAVALWLDNNRRASRPPLTPAEVSATLASYDMSTSGVVGNAGTGSPNRLLYRPVGDCILGGGLITVDSGSAIEGEFPAPYGTQIQIGPGFETWVTHWDDPGTYFIAPALQYEAGEVVDTTITVWRTPTTPVVSQGTMVCAEAGYFYADHSVDIPGFAVGSLVGTVRYNGVPVSSGQVMVVGGGGSFGSQWDPVSAQGTYDNEWEYPTATYQVVVQGAGRSITQSVYIGPGNTTRNFELNIKAATVADVAAAEAEYEE